MLSVVESMAVAALTAPKGRGRNTLHIKVLSGEDLSRLAARMRDIGTAGGGAFFARDAANVELSTAVLLIGTEISPLQLQSCGFCGMGNCETKNTQQIGRAHV